MIEVWAAIPGFPGYEASTFGRIRSLDRMVRSRGAGERLVRGRALRVRLDRDGYERLNVSIGGVRQTPRVQVLVALAFIGPQPTRKHEVAHWDGVRAHNVPSNLRWATTIENNLDKARHGTIRLSPASVRDIRAELALGTPQNEIARAFSVSKQTINNIALGKSWRAA